MSQWNVTFTDGSFVIMKDVPPGVSEADVRKEILQQPKYRNKKVDSVKNLDNASTAPGPITKPPAAAPAPTTPTVKPPAEKPAKVKPTVTNPNAPPGHRDNIKQPDGTYKVDVVGTSADKNPPQGDDVINNAVKKQEEAEQAKKAAAEADAKARKSKDEDDKKAALKAQEEATQKKIEAEKAKKDAEEKNKIVNNFKKDGEARADSQTPEPAKVTTAEPAKVTTAEPAKTATAEPAKTATAEPAKVTTAEPAKTATAEPAKSDEPEGPSLWDRIKSGAKEVGQAIGGALTPSSEPAQTSTAQTATPPSKEQLKADIEGKLAELERSSDPAVRERAKAARNKLAGVSGGTGADSGAKVQGPAGAPGGKADVKDTSGAGTVGVGGGKTPGGEGPGAGTNQQGTKPGAEGPGTNQQGAPGTGDKQGTTPAAGSEVDNDRIRKERRLQDAEEARLKKLLGDKPSQPGGWRDAGFGTRVWRGGPGKDPKWPQYTFADGDIMPAASNSTGVDPAKNLSGGKPVQDYVGGKGSDKYDAQRTAELLLGKEQSAQRIEQLKKQAGLKEDFSRILKLAGLSK